MCDSFVALPPATLNGTVILAKSADCQVNEAHALVRFPARKYAPGAAFKATHLVVPQAAETYEVILGKSFWTWGAEVGINEYGVAIGNEAVFTTLQQEEKSDGLIVIDMLRLGLERGRTAREAIDAITTALEAIGQGGNCELAGNSHFDGAYLIADAHEAWVLETAGRQWAAKQVTDGIGSISNVLMIGDDWNSASIKDRINWANSYSDPSMAPLVGAYERQACSLNGLAAARGNITVRTAFNVLRQHGESYHPATSQAHRNICVHAGAGTYQQWQAVGAMVAETSEAGTIGWFTATSGTCVSIFKPVFTGVELPDMGPVLNEQNDPRTLWWKHELLHRHAMTDFAHFVPEIRHDFDQLEDEFLTAAPTVLKGTPKEKKEFMDDCFMRAEQATDRWIQALASRDDLAFEDEAYRGMWNKYNRMASFEEIPAQVGSAAD
jgi:secernin